MGNGLSKEQEQYFGQIHQLLKASGYQVKKQNLINLLHVVKEYCPWLPDKRSLDLEIWEKVGQKLKWHQESGTPIGHQNLFYLRSGQDFFDAHSYSQLGYQG